MLIGQLPVIDQSIEISRGVRLGIGVQFAINSRLGGPYLSHMLMKDCRIARELQFDRLRFTYMTTSRWHNSDR
jgi:hypothetical protein